MAKYKPGQSGNPSGRPRKDIAGLQPLLVKHGGEVLQKVIDAALDGDMIASRLILERCFPAIKPTSIKVEVPPGKTLDESGDNIITATLDGTIPADISAQLMTALSNQAKLVESTELLQRIEELEKNAK